MAAFFISLAGAIGANVLFILIVLASIGVASVYSIIIRKSWIPYVLFGGGVLWYLLTFFLYFVDVPQGINSSAYYSSGVLEVVVFLIIGFFGLKLIRRQIAKTLDKQKGEKQ